MWKSCLLIDVGNNPDRPRPGRLWLRNIYHVHQRLSMAFPSEERTNSDPQFLAPFEPDDFAKQVGVERKTDAGFLFRIDPGRQGRAVILVQSAAEPDWEYAFGLKKGLHDERGRPIGNAGYLLAAPPQVKPFDPSCFDVGQTVRFRVRVNLSKKIKKSQAGVDVTKPGSKPDGKGRPQAQSKRVALTWNKDQDPEQVIREWFAKKGGPHEKCPCDPKREPDKKCPGSFEVHEFHACQIGWSNGYRSNGAGDRDRLKFRSALLEGTLTVTNAHCFRQAIIHGIGSGKAFGFGLLSVAPCRTPLKAETA